mmetsp:Transcript_7671/g.11293  ORF Transcript_7671/g.11293 Transcript_7671/m.11293 type:complete len:215 (-) Transcript_7671:1569-2213(-)
MERTQEGLFRSVSIVMLIVVTSIVLVRWDLEMLQNLSVSLFPPEVWSLGMCFTITSAWLCIPVFAFCLACNKVACAKCIGAVLLFLGGPNLLIWNIVGTSVDALQFKELPRFNEVCILVVIWGALYTISVSCNWALGGLVWRHLKARSLAKKISKWKSRKAQEALLEGLCAICMDGYASTEGVRVLKCSHSFHKDCVGVWLSQCKSCPVCRCEV